MIPVFVRIKMVRGNQWKVVAECICNLSIDYITHDKPQLLITKVFDDTNLTWDMRKLDVFRLSTVLTQTIFSFKGFTSSHERTAQFDIMEV